MSNCISFELKKNYVNECPDVLLVSEIAIYLIGTA